MTVPTPMLRLAAGLWLTATAFVACAAPVDGPTGPAGALAARGGGGGGITVSAATPSYGKQGETGKAVAITGSGFQPGDQATWQRGGVADPKIQVVSTQYVSSTQLVATISIAADAELAFYDIAISAPGRKGGIGTELFEVTQATAIEGAGLARGVNENGEVTGQQFFWSQATGLINIGVGSGWDIDEAGQLIAGISEDQAVIWTRSGNTWTRSNLPRGPSAVGGNARSLASDGLRGAAIVIGGEDKLRVKGQTYRRLPRLWLAGVGGWQQVALPTGTSMDGIVNGVTATGVAVGFVSAGAAVWEPNGAGGWTLTVLGEGNVEEVNTAGTLAVGAIGGSTAQAAYWQKVGGTWSSAIPLPVPCAAARSVDDLGRIAVSGCDVPGSKPGAGIMLPPYGPTNVIYLGGFGNRTDGAQVEALSPQGTWIVGRARMANNNIVGAYWNIF